MLARDPVERPRDGAELVAALGRIARALEPGERPPPRRAAARRGPIALAAAAVAAVALAAGGLWWSRDRGAVDEAPALPSDARVTVAVADFENQTGEPELSGLSGLLITSLEQSRRLSVLTRVRMLDILKGLGKDGVAAIDEPLGREVARSAGVRALVLATIRRFDQLYAIELKVLDPARSEYLFTLSATGEGKRSIPGMIDRLSTDTRERLRESPAEVRATSVALASATTASLDAYAHYFRGEQHKEATRYEPALAAYRRAIAADPSFALAHYQLAYLGEFTGLDAATRTEAIEAAIRNVDKVPAKERLLILAWKAHMERRNDEAHALYARAIADYPEDKDVLYMAGDLFFHEERPADALPLFERALRLDPTWEPALMHLTDSLAALGRTEELTERSRWWVENAPTGSAHRALARAHQLAGRWEEALERARHAFRQDGTIWSRTVLAESLMLLERFGEAEELLRAVADAPARGSEAVRGVPALFSALSYQGKRREALAAMEKLPPDVDHKWTIQARLLVHLVGEYAPEKALPLARALAEAGAPPNRIAGVLALAGDAEAAARAAEKLEKGPELTFYQAVTAWRAGDGERAWTLLRAAGADTDLDSRPGLLWMRARVALETGRPAEAIESLRGFRAIPSGLFRAMAYPRSLYDEAIAHEKLGDREKAREAVGRLLRLWKGADRDHPLLAEARALAARLDGASAARPRKGGAERRPPLSPPGRGSG
jgi:tetratricopeptide (TPR) repeat protein